MQRELRLGHLEAARGVGLHEVGDPGFEVGGHPLDDARGEAGLGEHVAGALDEAVPCGCHDDAASRRAAGRATWSTAPATLPAKLGMALAATRTYSEATPAAASAAAASEEAATTSAASPRSKLENVHHTRRGSGRPGALNSVASRNWRTVRKSPAARSIGASAPAVAALHAAPRNSRFVSARLDGAAGDPLGLQRRRRRHALGQVVRRAARAARAGRARATPCPRRGCPRRSSRACPRGSGTRARISRARWRTAGVSSSSRLGGELHALDRLGQRPLVGDREGAQLLDLVAEELDAHGVVGRGREHVEDAAAHGELAAAGDHVDARVGEVDELRRRARRGRSRDRPRRARSARARRGCRRGAAARRAPMRRRRADAASRLPAHSCDAPQGVQSAPDGLGRRAEPLVRQGLPGGELEELGVVEVRRDRRPHRFALAARGGDHEQRRRQPRLGTALQQPASSGASMPGGRREVGVPQGLGERAVDRGGARERRVQALQDHPTSLRGAPDAAAAVRSARTHGERRRGRRDGAAGGRHDGQRAAPRMGGRHDGQRRRGVAGARYDEPAPRSKGPRDHRRRRRIGSWKPRPRRLGLVRRRLALGRGRLAARHQQPGRADRRARALPRDRAPRRRAARALRQPVRDQRGHQVDGRVEAQGLAQGRRQAGDERRAAAAPRRGAGGPPVPVRVGEGARRP